MSDEEDAKYLAWLERLFAEHVSKENLTSGDVRRRVSGTMSAVRALRLLEGDLFGLGVQTLRPELLMRLSEQYRARFEKAVDEWRIWLEGEYGSEGVDAFRKIGENCAYFDVPLVPLKRSPEVDAAFAELANVLGNVERASATARQRGEAEDDESIGYFLAPPTAEARLIQDMRDVLPAQVEGLYAILDTLDIFTTPGAGGKSDEQQSDYVLIQPLESVEDVSNEVHGDFWTLHVHDMGRFLCFNPKGELWTWNRFEPEPKLAAPDVAAYLRALAGKYQ